MVMMKPQEPDAPAFIFQLLNQRKYPASQLYLLMTLGPAVALLPWAGRVRGWLADALSVFGRVPFFYYLLHIPLIHVSALLVNLIVSGATQQQWYNSAPYVFVPEESRWSLALLYALFAIDVMVLYFACQWYLRYKFSHPNIKWLKYI
jgi:hypothetical protein